MLPASIKHGALSAVFVATFFIAGSAHSACATPAFDVAIEEQLTHLPECQRSAPYLAQLGQKLNALGRYSEALDHLERALLFDPNLPQAQLDYAIALAGTGDTLSARLLLDGILAQSDLLLEQLGWEADRGRSFLEEQLGASSRSQLSDPQLLQFNMLLEGELLDGQGDGGRMRALEESSFPQGPHR